jgi:hypothetical protein
MGVAHLVSVLLPFVAAHFMDSVRELMKRSVLSHSAREKGVTLQHARVTTKQVTLRFPSLRFVPHPFLCFNTFHENKVNANVKSADVVATVQVP